ncbi:uncharacterized protein SOCEGT47_025800 [Sorangium cellulosum]|uniref:Uncharacterized protein n=1 Tax=Sorangium cellulosum TaxID=56 RepID=A0A4P2PYX7_SORCE|nr:uncharacterized protein SOCEGT47_025800 [Sorangium cellulosum]
MPVALGGFDGTGKKQDHWLLAGYALEDYLARSLPVRGRMRGEILCVGARVDERIYLETVARSIGRRHRTALRRSPFERVEPAVGATFLASHSLHESVLSDVRSFYRSHPFASLDLAGTIDLDVDDPGGHPWDRAFRELAPAGDDFGREAVPFVSLMVLRSPEQADSTVIIVWSESSVWLREGGALGGRIGPRAADENLARLAGFVRCLAREAEHVQLHVPVGSPAAAERERLSDALLAP